MKARAINAKSAKSDAMQAAKAIRHTRKRLQMKKGDLMDTRHSLTTTAERKRFWTKERGSNMFLMGVAVGALVALIAVAFVIEGGDDE